MSWFSATGKILLLVVLFAALGSYYGYPLQAVILLLLVIVGFWLYQMQRVQLWLNEPSQIPPDGYGIWGDLLARTPFHHRRNAEAQASL